jgi:hypothetical protein
MGHTTSFTVRKWHKWFSLIVGIQAMLWLISGAYMVVVNLDFIHGDHLVKNMNESMTVAVSELVSFDDMVTRFPDATEIKLLPWMGQPFYRVDGPAGTRLIDALTGINSSPLSSEDATAVAQYHYAGTGPVISTMLLTDLADAPTEIQSRPLPLWQVRFDDAGSTSFYISPIHGQLVSRRHTYWRLFDIAWMLHIMDYKNRADVNNNLFRVFATLGTITAFFGMWILLYSFRLKNKDAKTDAGATGAKS